MEVVLYFRPSGKSYSKPEKLAGILEIAEKARIHVQVIEEEPTRDRVSKLVAYWKCKGIIVECGGRKKAVDHTAFGKVPVVFFNHSFDALPARHFAVSHDSRSTGALAARELLLNNFARFYFVPHPSNPFWSQERRQGFGEALALNGKSCMDFSWSGRSENATERIKHLQKFVKSIPKPSAVFAANDAVAAEVITAAHLSAIAIPDDLAILGVDNSTDICEHTKPTLTSIEPDFRRGGNLAMLTLMAAIRDRSSFRGPRQRTFGDTRVIRRLSTKKLQRNDQCVLQALDLIRQKACNGLTAADVVRLFPCSRRMADLRFTQATGHTILDEIQSVRLDRAKQLLLNPNQELKTISDFCGFKHPNSLRKFFLKETGMTLGAWRRKNLTKPEPKGLPAF